MIYDCFSFFNELDLLEIRLNELADAVDRFVISESELTHNGKEKPLYFESNKSRFSKFADKIIHVVVTRDSLQEAEHGATFQERSWMRENIQRNAIAKGLVRAGANDDDIVIVSDLDEIPRASAVREAAYSIKRGEITAFKLNNYTFFLNLRNVSDPYWVNDPKMADCATFFSKAAYKESRDEVFVLPTVNLGPTATRFRYLTPTRRIQNAGWHFSYCGGIEAIVKKVKAFNERGLYERNDLIQFVTESIAKGKTLYGFDHCLSEQFDDMFPCFAVANKSRFSHLLTDDSHANSLKNRFLRRYYGITGSIRRLTYDIGFLLTPSWLKALIKHIAHAIGIKWL